MSSRGSAGWIGPAGARAPDPCPLADGEADSGRWRLKSAAVEPVIGHLKAEHRMERNYLKGREGDRANAVLAAAGYNFKLLIRWSEALLRAWFQALIRAALTPHIACNPARGESSRTTRLCLLHRQALQHLFLTLQLGNDERLRPGTQVTFFSAARPPAL